MAGFYILVEVQAYNTVPAARAPEHEENPPITNRFLSTPRAERSAAPDLQALLEARSQIRGGAAIDDSTKQQSLAPLSPGVDRKPIVSGRTTCGQKVEIVDRTFARGEAGVHLVQGQVREEPLLSKVLG